MRIFIEFSLNFRFDLTNEMSLEFQEISLEFREMSSNFAGIFGVVEFQTSFTRISDFEVPDVK
jgi:hypothetical protein